MKNKFRIISAGLVIGLLTSLVLPTVAAAQKYANIPGEIINSNINPNINPVNVDISPFLYKRIIVKPQLNKVVLQKTFQPDVVVSASFSGACGPNYIPTSSTYWAPLTTNLISEVATGTDPAFLISNDPAVAVATSPTAGCKVLLPTNATFNTFLLGTTKYKFDVGSSTSPNSENSSSMEARRGGNGMRYDYKSQDSK